MGLLQSLYRAPGGESEYRRILLVTLALIYSITASGIVFGYSGLYDVLLFDVNAFGEFCEDGEKQCTAQLDRLSRMYTLGATTISGCAFLVGLFLDFAGPRITVCLGSLLLAGGLLAVAYAQEISSSFYYLGFFLLAVGGPCIFNSTFSFGELFPDHSAAIIGALSTGGNSSTVVFCIFAAMIHSWGISFKSVFLAYTALPVFIFVSSLLLFPDRPFETGNKDDARFKGELHRVWTISMTQGKYPADVENKDIRILPTDYPNLALDEPGLEAPLLVTPGMSVGSPLEMSYHLLPGLVPPESDGTALSVGTRRMSAGPGLGFIGGRRNSAGTDLITGRKRLFRRRSLLFDDGPPDIYNSAFGTQIWSSAFWSMALVTAFFVLRVNFYIETLFEQLLFTASLQFPGDPLAAREAASYYAKLFNYLLPPGGLAMIPVVGFVLVEWGFAPSFLILAILHMLFCIVDAYESPPLQLQVLAFVLYAVFRPFLFGSMAAYIGRLFGFKNFGKLYGLMRVVGSVAVSLEYPLQLMTVHFFNGQYVYIIWVSYAQAF
ncbi:major facilitator superfamily protein [Klebsormidium nitens]|uniref:Major facilitator superfamily protein n=1 Tax=Klebsormidium nitens TaxID=105231 RepID=A0A1Y1IDX6_KLENI|nr:major facilitator superfamily protein [Klebsormidium nitens]|eukprot:GAQ86927.1 major facilitator superfamily protein [Klebsormidium nitens]